MPDDLGKHLFTFAVLTDSHVNEEEGRSASPYACNLLANGRLRYVVQALNRDQPAFTVHLGDMGNPIPELGTYGQAAEKFHHIVSELESDLHLVAGNHCLGDKPKGWVPVPKVCEDSLAKFERLYGPYNHSFDHGPCHFTILNSLIINSDLECEQEQKEWLEADLERAEKAGQRLWVMMHYPAYVARKTELDSYDNVGEPGRSWLLHQFARHGVEAVYSGHVHYYFYNRHKGTNLYTIPATSFVRQDYSELFNVPPKDREGGRNEEAKLGYCLVRVYENGHVNHIVRTLGRGLAEGEHLAAPRQVRAVHPREKKLAPLGVDIRENWLARGSLHPNNSVSPFTRRSARNDWSHLALEEMGVWKVRLSLQELVKDDVLERMATLQAAGFEFTVFSYGVPGEGECAAVREHRELLAGWELIMRLDEIDQRARRIARMAPDLLGDDQLPFYLNEVRERGQARVDDANVKHEANYGFHVTEREKLGELKHSAAVRDVFKGFVFRIRRRGRPIVTPSKAIEEISRMGDESGLRHQAHILFGGNLTSDRFKENRGSANRVAESAFAAAVAGNVDVYFDTFEDIDRGYFVRNGLVDRRYDPRPAGRALAHLNAALSEVDLQRARFASTKKLADARCLSAVVAGRFLTLVMPRRRCSLTEIHAPDAAAPAALDIVDLESGVVSGVSFTADGSHLRFASPVGAAGPQLVIGLASAGPVA